MHFHFLLVIDQVKVSPTQMPEIAFRPAQVEGKKKSESLKDPVEQAAEILKVAPKLSSKFSTIDSEGMHNSCLKQILTLSPLPLLCCNFGL